MLTRHPGFLGMMAAAMIASVVAGTGNATAQDGFEPRLEALSYYPPDGGINVPQSLVLRWSAGEATALHDVYFGEDANAVAKASPATVGIYRGRQPLREEAFDPGPLEWNKTYFWRIDEVNDAHPAGPWKGEVWRFTTAAFLVIDDFESYDDDGNRIYETWIDGWVTGNGSLIGYGFAPYARIPIYHSGRQCMPYSYDNSVPPYYSEAYRTWETPQDWTIRGGTDLSLWLTGRPASFIEDPNGRMIVNGSGGDTRGTDDSPCFVRRQLVGNGEIVTRIDSLTNAKGWARAGVRICGTLDYMPLYAAMTVTAEHGGSFIYRAREKTAAVQIGSAGIRTPHWVKLTRTGNVLTPQHSADGKIWLDVTDTKGKPVAVTIEMPESVYIGLCVVSDSWDRFARGEFSNVATNGDVRGPWLATYGGTNSRDDLYVALEDAAGKLAVSVHPDPAAVNFTKWTQWRIPLSDFASLGVDVAAIRTMYIGMGDRDHPQPAGSGQVHFDDICVLPAAAVPATTFGPNPGVRAKYSGGSRSDWRLLATGVEDSIDHDWGDGEIAGGLSDNVSAVWTANLEVPGSGTYTLITSSNNAAMLSLDGWAANRDWPYSRPSDKPVEVWLDAGHPYALEVDWSHGTGDAKAQLWWEGPSIPRQIIPAGPLQLPFQAAGPYPPNGAVDVPQSPMLMWRAGEAATHHDIYFGYDADMVAAATTADDAYRGRFKANETAFDPGIREWGKTCYWRVDEVNEADPNNSWKGRVWRFATADFLVIDDFESYSDEEGNGIYEYWIDAFATPWPGSMVHLPSGPYVERAIVHGGRQSMPFDYNNVRSPGYSEVERDFSPAVNWRVNDLDTLILYVRGQTTNNVEPLYVTIMDSSARRATAVCPDAQATQATEWIEWRMPLDQFAGVVTRVKRLIIGVGKHGRLAPGGAGRIYIDDIRVVGPAKAGTGDVTGP